MSSNAKDLLGINTTTYKMGNDELLVLTLNMHTYQEANQSAKFDLMIGAIVKLDIDIILLQECAQHHGSLNISEGNPIHNDNMAFILSQKLKQEYQLEYYFVWDWAHYGWNVWEEGVAVLSKYPILDWESRYVSTYTSKNIGSWETVSRMAIYASVDVPWFGRVNVFSVHLSWRVTETDEEQNSQIRRLQSFVEEKENITSDPVLSFVGGDFNGDPTSDPPWSEGYETMMVNNNYVDTYLDVYSDANFKPSLRKHDTVKGDIPGRIDYIFMKENNHTYSVNASQIVFTPTVIGEVSDHYGVLSKVKRMIAPYESAGGFKAMILTPNGSETLTGTQTLVWTARSDTYNQNFSSSVFYSEDQGINWILLTANQSSMGYNWDTSWIPSSSNYLLKVVILRSDNIITEDVSDGLFTLFNHILTIPTVIYPNGGEIVNESIMIEWTAAIDSLGHDIDYRLEYSFDTGATWIGLMATNTTTFEWDTLDVVNGKNYSFKVIANCLEDRTTEDQSDTVFEIRNHVLSIPTVKFPNGGEILSGPNRITWSQSLDTLGELVTYSVHFSEDSGNSWILLANGLETTLFTWDVSSVYNGDQYLIRVVATCSSGLSVEDISDTTFSIVGGLTSGPSSSSTGITNGESTKTTENGGVNGWTFLFSLAVIAPVILRRKLKK
ncbi:MAG: endonuclease/exonuclease/phosphatase family protein [Candidatus Hodarchaeales archaeon]